MDNIDQDGDVGNGEETGDGSICVLSNRGIASMVALRDRVRYLNLSFNRIEELVPLPAQLETIDVSHNRIINLEIVGCHKLRVLRAHANRIHKIDLRVDKVEEVWLYSNCLDSPALLMSDIKALASTLLIALFAPNTFVQALEEKKYRLLMISLLPHLQHLDDAAVLELEREKAHTSAINNSVRRIFLAQTKFQTPASHRPMQKKRHTLKTKQLKYCQPSPSLPLSQVLDTLPELPKEAPAPQKAPSPSKKKRIKTFARPAPPAHFKSMQVTYKKSGRLALSAPGGTDASVVLRYSNGAIAIAADGGCLRAFYRNNALAFFGDAAGNASLSDANGHTLYSISAQGAGFSADKDGNMYNQWSTSKEAPYLIELELIPEILGIHLDAQHHFATLFFSLENIKCSVDQNGLVLILAPDSDLFGQGTPSRTAHKKSLEQEENAILPPSYDHQTLAATAESIAAPNAEETMAAMSHLLERVRQTNASI